jgi:glycosyltransferase involved in cell wall biosynthesis
MKGYIKSAIYKTAKYVLGYNTSKKPTWADYTRESLHLADKIDCLPAQLVKQQQHPERVATNIADRVCNWYLPQFSNPFYGGIMTILRVADYLQRSHGIKQRILICGNSQPDEIGAKIASAFPALSQAEVIVIDKTKSLADIPPADYSIATLWTTAYVLLAVENTGYKFYMIQDFEPAFYPAGSTYAQAELSYHFGFYGIANTQSLKEIYERDYGGCAVVLQPSIDKRVFYPSIEENTAPCKKVFYYARPDTPRNGFELAAAALRRLKQKYGNSIDIVCAGADWNPGDYGLSNVIRSLGLLPYSETGDLYRSCHVGLVMMMTKHPSYLPFEMMACGTIVVTNFNPANIWLLKNGENCLLSAPSASCLAAMLSYGLDHYDELAPLRQRAATQIFADAGDWDNSLSKVARFILDPPAEFIQQQSFFSSTLF